MNEKRREFITLLGGAAAAWPLAASAQAKVYAIGILETVPRAQNQASFAALLNGLRELGYVEGQNLRIDYRSADGQGERFPELAAELVRNRVDLIVTRGTPAARAAKAATATIPIVMAAIGEPLGVGVVASLARPGGNVTGLSAFVTELSGKRIELLKETFPSVSTVGFLNNLGNPVAPPQWEATRAVASQLRLTAELFDVRSEADIVQAFSTMGDKRMGALSVGIDFLIQAHAARIVELAAQQRIPTAYPTREIVEIGGLLSYGVNYPGLYFRAAGLIDKIFKGAIARRSAGGTADQVRASDQFAAPPKRSASSSTDAARPRRRGDRMKRREFITLLGGAAAAWPLAAHAQQPAMPVIGFSIRDRPNATPDRLRGFARGSGTSALSRARTWRSNTAAPRVNSSGCPSLRPNWFADKSP